MSDELCVSPRPDHSAASAFIRRLFPKTPWPGHILIWTLDPHSKKKTSHWCASPDDADQEIVCHGATWSRLNVYVGMGMSSPEAQKGRGQGDLSPNRRLLAAPAIDKRSGNPGPQPSVHYIPAMWADVDYGDTGHKAGNNKLYAPSLEAVLERLPALPLQPTIILRSGHGIQLFWLFNQLLDISGDRAKAADRQARWIGVLRDIFQPYDLDSVIDLTRVMRLPGFINNKEPGNPILVHVTSDDGPLITPEAVDSLLPPPPDRRRGRSGQGNASGRRPESLTVDPNAEPHPALFKASYEADLGFAWTWDGDRPDLNDQSSSGYDMALANIAAKLGWPEQEICDLVVARRRKTDGKMKSAEYYDLTVGKALEAVKGQGRDKKNRGPLPSSTARPTRQGRDKKNRDVGASLTRQLAKQLEMSAVEEYINGIATAGDVIYWRDDFHQIQEGSWCVQSRKHFEKQILGIIAKAREAEGTVVVSRDIIAACVESLAISVTPPCIDTALLKEADRLKNVNLDTGAVLPGSAFTNGILSVGDDGDFTLSERQPRHFYTSSRPYPFPTERPPRPQIFDEWLMGRLPVQDTRTAFWELIGATISHELHDLQRLVALLGPGRTGKGAALRTVAGLVGTECTATYTGGPGRLAASQFTLAKLISAVLVLLPDMPPPPRRDGMRMDRYMDGLSIVKSISGGDPISIEKKFKDVISAEINAGVWMDSNFDIAGFIQTEQDSFSWQERIIPLPFLQTLPEEQRIPQYESRFVPERGQISWYAVEAYAKAKARGAFTWSTEMRGLQVQLARGKGGPLEAFFKRLHTTPGAWLSREEVRSAAETFIGEPLDNGQASRLYHYCLSIPGVAQKKRVGTLGFKNLTVQDPDPH